MLAVKVPLVVPNLQGFVVGIRDKTSVSHAGQREYSAEKGAKVEFPHQQDGT